MLETIRIDPKTFLRDHCTLPDLITVVKDLETDAARYMYQVT